MEKWYVLERRDDDSETGWIQVYGDVAFSEVLKRYYECYDDEDVYRVLMNNVSVNKVFISDELSNTAYVINDPVIVSIKRIADTSGYQYCVIAQHIGMSFTVDLDEKFIMWKEININADDLELSNNVRHIVYDTFFGDNLSDNKSVHKSDDMETSYYVLNDTLYALLNREV